MEPADHEPNLNDDDVLSLWVGRVARTHALLEYNVDNVHRFLVRQVGHVPGNKSVKGFDQLVSECRKLLQQSDAGPEIVTSGDTALLQPGKRRSFEIGSSMTCGSWTPCLKTGNHLAGTPSID